MNQKIGYTCLVGAPNSGKSTIFNHLIKDNISIVTHKAHTTRDRIQGIITTQCTQLVFIDTPGYLKKPKHQLEKLLAKKSLQEIRNVDFICIIIDIATKNCLDNPLLDTTYFHSRQKLILVFNKIDLIKEKNTLLHMIQKAKNRGFSNIFMVSALRNQGMKDLFNYLVLHSPEGIWHYKDTDVTTRSIKKLTEDITIGNLYKLLNKELPYQLQLQTESWQETSDVITIHQSITVLKDSQKRIILGTKGENIKKISIRSRKAIEILTKKIVHLYLFIKISNWLDKKDVTN